MIPSTTHKMSLHTGLWQNASAGQISRRLNRSRPSSAAKHFGLNPAAQTRSDGAKATVTSIMPAKPTPPVDASVPPPEMRRCSLLQLDNGQCRWPLGGVHQAATLFCGDAAVPGFSYCGHHLRMARYESDLPQSDRGPHR